jgi:hypothetical protein
MVIILLLKFFLILLRPEKKECGGIEVSSWIIGGKETKPGTYPSAALLGREELVDKQDFFNPSLVRKVPKLNFTCGGTLINR